MSRRRNLSTKAFLQLVSLVLSISLWFYVLSSELLVAEKRLPLELITPEGLTLANVVTPEVIVKLKGPRVFLRNLFDPKDRVYVNLNRYNYEVGKQFNILLDESDIPIPLGVTVLEVRPTDIPVVLEQVMVKKVKIMPALVGEMRPELKLVEHWVVPDLINIYGPRNVVKKMDKLFTAPIDLATLQGEDTIKVNLEGMDPRLRLKERHEVEFKFVIRPRKANFIIKNVPIRYLSSHREIKSTIKRVAVDVLVPDGRESIKTSEVQVIADVPESLDGQGIIKLKAIMPEGVHLLQIHPESIEVTVQDKLIK